MHGCPLWVIRVARMRHRASQHVRYASDCVQIDAWGELSRCAMERAVSTGVATSELADGIPKLLMAGLDGKHCCYGRKNFVSSVKLMILRNSWGSLSAKNLIWSLSGR